MKTIEGIISTKKSYLAKNEAAGDEALCDVDIHDEKLDNRDNDGDEGGGDPTLPSPGGGDCTRGGLCTCGGGDCILAGDPGAECE